MHETPNIAKAIHEATILLDKYFIESPEEIVVEDIAMAQGLLVLEGGLTGAEARLIHNGNKGIIRIKESNNSSRRRFSVAHELGHWAMHKKSNLLDYCKNIEEGVITSKGSPEEIEANAFASELLMPRSFFVPRCRQNDPSIELIKQLADEFETSLTSTALRFIEHVTDNCFIVMSKDSEILWSKKTSKSCLWIDRYQSVQKNSSAWKCASEQTTESAIRRVTPDTWFPNVPKSLHVEVSEQSIKLGNYPYVLSLLVVTEDEKSDFDDGSDY